MAEAHIVRSSGAKKDAVAKVRRKLLLSAIGAGAVAAPAIAPGSADAKNFYYCPNTGYIITLGPYAQGDDRCAAAIKQDISWIGNYNFDDASVCAVLKPNRDGSGGNIGSVSCAISYASVTPFGYGYSTIINHSDEERPGFHGTASNFP